MKTIHESEELSLASIKGLMKFEPRDLFRPSTLLITIDEILAFDDTKSKTVSDLNNTQTRNKKVSVALTDIDYVIDEKLIKRKELRGYHRLTINAKNGEHIIVIFYPSKERYRARAFIKILKDLKIEVAKGKSNVMAD
jgi:hypothetical protein